MNEYVMLETSKGRKMKKVVKFNKASEYYLSEDDVRLLIDGADSLRNRVIISLMARCGLRRNEVRCLRIEDIDWANGWVSVLGKGAKLRTVPVSQQVLGDLRLVIGKRTEGFVFLSRSMSAKGRRMSNVSINNIVAKAGRKAGLTNPNQNIKNINPHLLRHSFARNWLKQGKRSEILRMVLGHSSIKTTIDIYGEPTMEEIKNEFTA